MTSGPCAPWAATSDVSPSRIGEVDAGALTDCLVVATEILWNLTGRRWSGVCADTIRPVCGCVRRRPVTGQGATGCGEDRRLLSLPGRPVVEVSAVTIDGVPLAAEDWFVLDRAAVGRVDGQSWPCSQALRLASSETGTWEVAYRYGTAPPPGGVRSAATLAFEMALASIPDAEGTRLPERVSSITRQGVTMAVLDPLTLLAEGRTGLVDVDLWVASVMHGDRRRGAAVHVGGASARKARRRT